MAVGQVTLPAQGTGSTTPQVAVDVVAGKNYEYIKLVDGTADSIVPVPSTVPADASSATRPGLWVNDQLMLFNGTGWDRARGSIANGLLVDVSRVTGTVTTSGTTTISGAIPAGTNNIGDVDVLTLPALPAGTNNIGDVDVLTLPALPAGTNNIGDVDLLTWLGSAAPTVGQKAMAASLPVVLASDQATVPVSVVSGGAGITSALVEANFVRPSDTTAYAASDQVSNSTTSPTVITLTGCASVNAGSGLIVGAELIDESLPGTPGQFELWLFDTTRTPNNDNSGFAPTVAQLRTVVAVIPFNLSYYGGTGRVYANTAVGVKFKCAAGTTSLFGNLVVKNAYTPGSAGRFDIRLFIEQG